MSVATHVPIRLASRGAHAVDFSVEPAGRDLLCRVHGGDAHVGSVALSEWREGRAHTRCLTAAGHREEAIARHAAHTLCAAARRNVACVAGIHFDSVSRAAIDAISSDAYSLARQAADRLRDARLREELAVPGGIYDRIISRREPFRKQADRVFDMSVPEALRTLGQALDAGSADGVGGEVRIFSPLYLSNACTNDCVYCGFRRSSDYERSRLSIDEVTSEARALAGRGIRAVDLVTGEIPADPFVDYVCRAVEAILRQTRITRVHLNLGSLSTAQYRRLREAGAAGYHLYQETYDPEAYLGAHRSGGKREMAARLDAPRRAAEAGFGFIGMGVLLGLADPREELARLAGHAAILGEEFPAVDVGFSLPRVQTTEADPDYAPARPVSDDDFVRAVAFLRIAHPEAHLTLTTRERPEIRDLLLRFGITRLSADVSTAPGGYAASTDTGGNEAREQFAVADQRSVDEIVTLVNAAGLNPVFD